jgi:hypothetical protein
MDQLYIALIGDIVGSKNYKDDERAEIQVRLENILDMINKDHHKFIAADFLLTLGDEFQGLLYPEAPVFNILSYVIEKLNPIQLRFGLGFGTINTSLKTEALGMDGPVFYCARRAMEKAKGRKGYSVVFETNLIERNDIDAINIILGMSAIVRNLWGPKYVEVTSLIRQGKTQKEVSKLLDVSQSNISQIINKAYLVEVKELEDMSSNFFYNILKYRKLVI